jgi:hypothetical protein
MDNLMKKSEPIDPFIMIRIKEIFPNEFFEVNTLKMLALMYERGFRDGVMICVEISKEKNK